MASDLSDSAVPSRSELIAVWLKIGLLSFGGPAGQIALMHKILVEDRKWIDEQRFLHALNYCMILPGPEAQQLAIYIGWLLNRTFGGLVSGLLFVLPGAIVMLGLSIAYALYAQFPIVSAVFVGVKAAVLIVVVEAVHRIGRRALKSLPMYWIAIVAFIAIFFFDIPFPLIIIGAGVVGLIGGLSRPSLFVVIRGKSAEGRETTNIIEAMAKRGELAHTVPSTRRSLWLLVVFGILWGGAVLGLFCAFGSENVFVQEAVLFSKLAVVTFGGAYAVLAYMAQQAVEAYNWLNGAEMLDGLGLAETTPGPLILVTQFVGFLGAYRHAVGIDPILAGVFGSIITVWVTFVPCFLWIFLGAPYIEHVRDNMHLSAALSGVTAAVAGVILNLAVWFGLRVAFYEVGSFQIGGLSIPKINFATADLTAISLIIVASVAVFLFHLNVLWTFVICGSCAMLLYVLI